MLHNSPLPESVWTGLLALQSESLFVQAALTGGVKEAYVHLKSFSEKGVVFKWFLNFNSNPNSSWHIPIHTELNTVWKISIEIGLKK